MVHIIPIKASYQIILSDLIVSLMNTEKRIKISRFFVDFNATTNKKCMEEFCDFNGFTSLIKKPTCFKNPDKPTCIGLTNQPNCFQHGSVFETGHSDFHLLTVTKFKKGFQKLSPKIVNYRDYKNFDYEKFRVDISEFDFGASDLEGFRNTIFCIFNKHAPIKRK